MIIEIKSTGKQVKVKDNPVCISYPLGGVPESYFGIGEVCKTTKKHERYRYDIIDNFCPHVHCTHSETANHLTSASDYIKPEVPLFQLCGVKLNMSRPDITAVIDGENPYSSHVLTSQVSYDPLNSKSLTRHHDFFTKHPRGVITELVKLPNDCPAGVYVLQTVILEIPQSDAHPTVLYLYEIE